MLRFLCLGCCFLKFGLLYRLNCNINNCLWSKRVHFRYLLPPFYYKIVVYRCVYFGIVGWCHIWFYYGSIHIFKSITVMDLYQVHIALHVRIWIIKNKLEILVKKTYRILDAELLELSIVENTKCLLLWING